MFFYCSINLSVNFVALQQQQISHTTNSYIVALCIHLPFLPAK
uniref:Uncharacterized protein n=1 Tax=Arundo donax TaxID=35708 RepID=A0A0A8XQL4_ARUDO